MQPIQKIKMTTAIAALATTMAVVGSPDGAGATTFLSRQTIEFVHTGPFSNPDRVIASGPIAGVGTGILEEFEASSDGSLVLRELLVFPNGTVTVSLVGSTESSFDPQTCIGKTTDSGQWTVEEGTGAFVGATGAGTALTHSVFIADRTSEGCATTGNLVLVSHWDGDVSLG